MLERDGRIGVLGMRVDARTRSAEQLQRFVRGPRPAGAGFLRDTQNYVQIAAHGATLWDVAPVGSRRISSSGSPDSNGRTGVPGTGHCHGFQASVCAPRAVRRRG